MVILGEGDEILVLGWVKWAVVLGYCGFCMGSFRVLHVVRQDLYVRYCRVCYVIIWCSGLSYHHDEESFAKESDAWRLRT